MKGRPRFAEGDTVELKRNFRTETHRTIKKGTRGTVMKPDPYDTYSLPVDIGEAVLYVPKIAVDNFLLKIHQN